MKNKILSVIITVCLCMGLFAPSASAITFTPNDFDIISQSAYLVNMDTGTVVFEKDADKELLPASLAKIMTAILVLEEVEDLEVLVEAPLCVFDELYLMNASTADIRLHEQVRMIDLLYALIMASACEAAGIIADYMSEGDTPAFVEKMNEKAEELGAYNTYFYDSHGLDDVYSHTTAYDMAKITEYALTLPLFEEIATTTVYEMPATNKHSEPRNIYHTNKMTRMNTNYYADFVFGIKTGTTGIDTKNLVSIAKKDGYNYLLVVLGGPTKNSSGEFQESTYIDSQNLYDWAFDSILMRTIVEEGEQLCEMSVAMGKEQDFVIASAEKDVQVLMPSDIELSSIQKVITENENIKAPLKVGDKVGTLELKLKDEVLAKIDLLSTADISQDPIALVWSKVNMVLQSDIMSLLLIGLIVLVVIYIIFAILYNKRKRKLRYQKRKSRYNKSYKSRKRR